MDDKPVDKKVDMFFDFLLGFHILFATREGFQERAGLLAFSFGKGK